MAAPTVLAAQDGDHLACAAAAPILAAEDPPPAWGGECTLVPKPADGPAAGMLPAHTPRLEPLKPVAEQSETMHYKQDKPT